MGYYRTWGKVDGAVPRGINDKITLRNPDIWPVHRVGASTTNHFLFLKNYKTKNKILQLAAFMLDVYVNATRGELSRFGLVSFYIWLLQSKLFSKIK